MKDIHHHKILILDFGSQYTQLIARRIREIGVYCEILPHSVDPIRIEQFHPNGIILSGGPETVTMATTPRIPENIFSLEVPVLGICYGMQAMAKQLAGEVSSSQKREFGHSDLTVINQSPLFQNLDVSKLKVWMSHGDKVTGLPNGFSICAETDNAPIAAFANEAKQFYGVQFHPEVTHTELGAEILRNFVLTICQLDASWTMSNIVEYARASIKHQVGDEKVLLALSGGVDSSVVAALLHEAIGEQLVCVFVDTGLLRLNEAQEVVDMFGQNLGINLIAVDASEKFMQALKGCTDPEEKRKIIGRLFIEVFEEQAAALNGVKYLAQGTIYPDVIESAGNSDSSHVIKSHHNVGGLPEGLNFELIEPIRELFKDEVRKLGLELGLPYDMVYRHPFPGPGLGVRILGEVCREYADLLRKADHIFISELRAHDLYHKVSQAFVVFLPVRAVGVMGDARQYDYVVSLRAVETIDFMTARWAQLPHEFLAVVANRIINEIDGIARVTYDISSKPPATIEWE